ncbi:hypothetical protein [Paenibacillus alvei]|uniref:hypothetical protein n=1 Tax=Paenibacillus alvei TaxID=44250 RepID=UPI00227E42C3|nr:hypothetical protein [Paenibacillus alvei]MCY7487504.1 hypothetical protein [Paenibacillus alvei]
MILVFSVSKKEFNNFYGFKFNGASKSWEKFVIANRNGGTHPYDFVEGPYLTNPGAVKNKGKIIGKGNQISINSQRMGYWLNRGYVGSIPINAADINSF